MVDWDFQLSIWTLEPILDPVYFPFKSSERVKRAYFIDEIPGKYTMGCPESRAGNWSARDPGQVRGLGSLNPQGKCATFYDCELFLTLCGSLLSSLLSPSATSSLQHFLCLLSPWFCSQHPLRGYTGGTLCLCPRFLFPYFPREHWSNIVGRGQTEENNSIKFY